MAGQNLICGVLGIPCGRSDSHQVESALVDPIYERSTAIPRRIFTDLHVNQRAHYAICVPRHNDYTCSKYVYSERPAAPGQTHFSRHRSQINRMHPPQSDVAARPFTLVLLRQITPPGDPGHTRSTQLGSFIAQIHPFSHNRFNSLFISSGNDFNRNSGSKDVINSCRNFSTFIS